MCRLSTSGRQRERPSRGEIDVLDFVIGLALVGAIPFLAHILYRLFEPRQEAAKVTERQVEPPPSADEVEERLRIAEAILAANAKQFLKQATDQADPVLRDKFRTWAGKALAHARERYDELEKFIKDDRFPQARTQFASHLEKIAERRKEIGVDLERVKQLDPLRRKDG